MANARGHAFLITEQWVSGDHAEALFLALISWEIGILLQTADAEKKTAYWFERGRLCIAAIRCHIVDGHASPLWVHQTVKAFKVCPLRHKFVRSILGRFEV